MNRSNDPLDKWRETENSVYLWQAYRRARDTDSVIPDEFVQYIDYCARGIAKMVVDAPLEGPHEGWERDVVKAFGLAGKRGGAGTPFKQAKRDEFERILFMATASDQEEMQWAPIFRKIAKTFGVSVEYVKKIHKRFMPRGARVFTHAKSNPSKRRAELNAQSIKEKREAAIDKALANFSKG